MKTDYKIHETQRLSGCPALTLAVEGWLDILQSGFGSNGIVLEWNQRVLWIEQDGEPVAIVTWSVQEWRKEAWISESYTKPEYRGRGCFRALYARLREIALKEGLARIAGGINANNEAMQAAARSVGREIDYVVFAETLPSSEEPPELVRA